MRLKRGLSTVLCWLLIGSSLPAKEIPRVCGTERGNVKEQLFLHKRATLKRRALTAREAALPVGKDVGNIALIYDSNGVVSRPNPFNLASKGITFTPAAEFTKYSWETVDGVFDTDAAANGTVLDKLNDDDTRLVPMEFAFPFYGKTYHEVWVNSDGNLTFGEGYGYSDQRSIGALAGGPPRIAALYSDLDPSRNLRAVRVLSEAERFVVSWVEVPEFGGSRQPQTFQLRLYPDGRIEFAYRTVNVNDAAVGIAPGRSTGATELVSFLAGSARQFGTAVAERFSNSDTIDTLLLAQRFYETHEDAYDYLAVYNGLGIGAGFTSLATELSVRTLYREGFGDIQVEYGKEYGSENRLQAFLNMGRLSDYPRDPYARVPSRSSAGDTSLSALAHETGHLFLALASVRDPIDPTLRPMLGLAEAHWSFNLQADASFMEGNQIEDKGENVSPRFETVATVERYSPLDQYLMGLRPPEEVPPTFYLRRSGQSNAQTPLKGVQMNGQRVNVAIEEVIEAEGRRIPDHTVSQRKFRMAMILVVREGREPAPEDIEQMERLRSEFEGYYERAADGRATIDTRLRKNLRLSTWPAAGVLQGSAIEASLILDRPAEADLPVVLKTRNGVAALPEAVVIPAGETQVSFSIEGVTAGVEEIIAEPEDPSYVTEEARIQVNDSAENLKIAVVKNEGASSGEQRIEVRLADRNLLPYPGLRVVAETASGTVETDADGIAGADGIVRLRWTTADAGSLQVSIEGTNVKLTIPRIR